MFKRKITDQIAQWQTSLKIKRRALIIKGLRQIGKTTIVREYCRQNYENVVYINFMDRKSLKKIFDQDIIVDDIIRNLSAALPGVRFIPNKTVIIFDEIQECANARAAIKPFMLDNRFDIIATGSLIGLRGYSKKNNASIPTGFEYILQMYPMDFEEYLWARGIDENVISYIKECYQNHKRIADVINTSFMEYYKEYLCVGGMPDAVNTFLITRDLNQVYEMEKGILENYKDDFGKHLDEKENEYVSQKELGKIIEVYQSIPAQLAKENKKFQYSQISKNAKGREYRFALTWLEEFGLIKLCYNLSALELPLEGYRKEDIFKVYVVDSGLFTAMLGQDAYNEILNEDFGIYKGALYENMVAEAQVKNNRSLYYFSKDSGLKIDFISKIGNELFAIESKAKNGTAKSLKTILESKEYSITKGIKLINGNIGEMNNIYTIPLYMAFFLK